MGKLKPTDTRVVIESVEPQVDGGRFPVKSPLGDPVTVTARVFADGHDSIDCVLRHRLRGKRAWSETPMEFHNNDKWGAEFVPDELGDWEFEVEGWVDHFGSWQVAMRKRVDAGAEVDVELLIGARLVAAAAGRAKGKEAKTLQADSATLADDKVSLDDRLALAFSDGLATSMSANPDRSRAVTTDRLYPVMVDRERAVFSTWYELFPRSWSQTPGEHGTFKDVASQLGYVADLGFDVLYLPPIHPVGSTFRKGPDNTLQPGPDDPGVPWAIGSPAGGHTAINEALGTIDDFRLLRDMATETGVELALDIAFQCSPDHPWVAEHPGWFKHRPDGTIQYAENPPKKYQDIYPLDFETDDAEGLWTALKGVFDHWIGEGIRIFRVDNPHTKSFAFWEWVIAELRARHPDVILLAEAFTRPSVMYRLAKLGFNQSYTYFTWRTTRPELVEYMSELARVGDYFRPNFWPNTPDILTEQLQTGGRAAFVARYVLAATLGSNCGIYGPAFELMDHEPLHPGSEEYLHSEKYELRTWDLERADSLAPIIKQVNEARRDHPALQRNNDLVFHRADNEMLICYSKSSGDDVVLVVVNIDPRHTQSGWVHLDADVVDVDNGQSFQVIDVLTNRRYTWSGTSNYVELDPAGIPAHIFTLKRKARQRTEESFDYYT
jgi:starch synthase (maltosyl-transferring)